MRYEVKKAGKVYYTTDAYKPPYNRKMEKAIQAAGYEIYVDGKKVRRSTNG